MIELGDFRSTFEIAAAVVTSVYAMAWKQSRAAAKLEGNRDSRQAVRNGHSEEVAALQKQLLDEHFQRLHDAIQRMEDRLTTHEVAEEQFRQEFHDFVSKQTEHEYRIANLERKRT